MTIRNRKSLIGTFALMATLSAPMAFAQQAQQADPAAAEQAAPTAQQAQPTSTAPTGAAPQKKSWADVDTDQNGSLSKSEASSVPALGQVFDQADANADGALTADEYKAYVAKAQGGGGKTKSGSGGQH